MRPIDADNLTARLRNSYKRRESALRTIGISDEAKGIIDSLIDVIDEEPTVALVKHGHWIFYKDMGEKYIRCSNCGAESGYDNEINWLWGDYCKYCGAKMDEVTE